jgi:hypothetical protein
MYEIAYISPRSALFVYQNNDIMPILAKTKNKEEQQKSISFFLKKAR